MKKITLFSVLAVLFAALSFTSCNTGDSETWTPLTPEQKSSCYSALSMYSMTSPTGSFTYFCKKTDKDGQVSTTVSDSTINADWSFQRIAGDTTIVITTHSDGAITKALADYIPSYTSNKSNSGLIEALKAYTGTTRFVCPLYFYATSPVSFLLNPQKLTYNLNYDGADHKIDFYFFGSSIYSIMNYGVYNPSNSTNYKMSLMFQLYGFKIDAADDDKNDPTRLEVSASTGTTVQYVPFYFNVK